MWPLVLTSVEVGLAPSVLGVVIVTSLAGKL